MTKEEFALMAGKAGLEPELYGAVIDGPIRTKEGFPVSGGTVTGVEWLPAWKTESEYRPGLGRQESKFLSKMPYAVLEKSGEAYHADVRDVNAWLRKFAVSRLARTRKANT